MKEAKLLNRRDFVKVSGALAVTVPIAALVSGRAARAQEKVSPDDPTAQAVSYVADASEASDHPQYQEGANCANCQLYLRDQEQDGWAPCPILQNKLVPAEAWCAVWQKAQS